MINYSLSGVYILHNDQFHHFCKFDTKAALMLNEYSLRQLSKFLNLDSSSAITVISRSVNDTNIPVIVDFFKNNNIKKVYFVTDDVFLVKCPHDSNELDASIINRYPNAYSIIDFDTILKIVNKAEVDNVVYNCDYNIDQVKSLYPTLNIKFFDLSVLTVTNSVLTKDIKFEYKYDCTYKICCFNFRPDVYRSIIVSLLYNQDRIFLTSGKLVPYDTIMENPQLPIDKFSLPIQEKIKEGLTDIETNNISMIWDIDLQQFQLIPREHWKVVEIINSSFCTLITETRYYTSVVNFSEKTLKPLLVKKPFLLLAPPGTLKLLQKLGFKTFNRWWDESYDDIEDHNERLEAVYQIAVSILNKPTRELQSILVEMMDILEYNQQHLVQLDKAMFDINSD